MTAATIAGDPRVDACTEAAAPFAQPISCRFRPLVDAAAELAETMFGGQQALLEHGGDAGEEAGGCNDKPGPGSSPG